MTLVGKRNVGCGDPPWIRCGEFRRLWIALLAAACVGVAACRGSEKVGNDKFSAIVVSQHWVTIGGKKLSYPKTADPEIASHLVEIKPGGETGRHYHPGPTYMYVLEGVLVVELDDGTRKEYSAGQALLEDGKVWVNNRNPGSSPTRFLAVILGERGKHAMVFSDG